jgi:ArsR family transcriptional regulator
MAVDTLSDTSMAVNVSVVKTEIASFEACCAPLAAAPLDAAQAEDMAGALRVLADPARLRLVSLLASSEEACVCDLTIPIGLAQPTVSHHLKVLFEAGLIDRERRGRWVYYRLRPGPLEALAQAVTPRPSTRSLV